MKFEEWIEKQKGKVFRYLIYRKVFTPYEQEKKFIDESEYENGAASTLGLIENAVSLGGSDWLLGIRSYDFDERTPCGDVVYVRLSEIRLARFDCDNAEEDEKEDEAVEEDEDVQRSHSFLPWKRLNGIVCCPRCGAMKNQEYDYLCPTCGASMNGMVEEQC